MLAVICTSQDKTRLILNSRSVKIGAALQEAFVAYYCWMYLCYFKITMTSVIGPRREGCIPLVA